MYTTQQNITARMLSEHLIIIHVEFNTEQKNMHQLKTTHNTLLYETAS